MARRALLLFPKLNNLVFFGVYEPLVMEIFSAIAKQEGCEVELIDLRLDPKGCRRLASSGYVPDMIGLTTHGFAEVPIVNRIARECKELWPDTPIAVGGGQATVSPELIDARYVDVIVRGPGERIWRDMCRNGMEAGVGRVVEDPDPPRIYTYPLPDRQITAKYRKHYRTNIPHHTGRPWGRRGRTGFTLLTQGCPFRCSFCVIWHANLGLYRRRPLPEIVADLKSMDEEYIYLGDDNTFADAKFAHQLADAIRDAGIRKEISSYCRADHICNHPDLMQKWHDIGLRYLVVGIEATSTERLKQYNKKTDAQQNLRSLKILRDIGIYAIPHILISPDMTPEDFDDVYRFIEEHEFEYPVTIPLTPLPGTEDFDTYKAQGRIVTEKLDFYTFMYNVIEPANMSLREFDRQFDRLVFRTWSWSRFLRGKCGDLSLVGFLKWWAFVRVLIFKLRWRRREIYRAAEARRSASQSGLPHAAQAG
jgi:magnesium-protoporphyrin IX monomethyl ester (oxidative) cyclase